MPVFIAIAFGLGGLILLFAFAIRFNQRWERSARTMFFMVDRKLASFRNYILKPFVGEAKRAEMEQKLRDDTAKKAFNTFGNMKGVMMKLAQIMSFVDDKMDEGLQQELRKLQSAAPPMEWGIIKNVIQDELGQDPSMIFRTFDETPIAAASIGQVHKAQLPSGEWVAVKIQYPGVDQLIESDLKNLRLIFKLGEKNPVFGTYDGEAMAEEMGARIREELDYELEARNQKDFRTIFAGHPFIYIPKIYTEYSTKRVLVSEFIEGQSFYEYCTIDSESERNSEVARKISTFSSLSVYRHGLFNADPHPGNYIFHEDGRITFLDFGCVKRWSRETARQFRKFMRGLVVGDLEDMMEAIKNMGVIKEAKEDSCRAFFQLWFDISPHLMQDETMTLDPSLFPDPNTKPPPNKEDFKDITLPTYLFYLIRVFAGLGSIMVRLRARDNFHRQTLGFLDDGDAFDAFLGDRTPEDLSVPVEFATEYTQTSN